MNTNQPPKDQFILRVRQMLDRGQYGLLFFWAFFLGGSKDEQRLVMEPGQLLVRPVKLRRQPACRQAGRDSPSGIKKSGY